VNDPGSRCRSGSSSKKRKFKEDFFFSGKCVPLDSDMTPPPICQFMALQGDSLTAALQLNLIEANGHVAPAPLLEGQKKIVWSSIIGDRSYWLLQITMSKKI
jgi:hypothetical protein